VEKVKNLSNYMTISANMSGELQFKIQNDSSEVITYFKDLLHPEINCIFFLKIDFFFFLSTAK